MIVEYKPITVWYRLWDGGWDFNHIEDGHVPFGQWVPTPKFPHQKANWDRSEWMKELKYLDEKYCIVDWKRIKRRREPPCVG